MSDIRTPRMYGITCKNVLAGEHAIRLGKEPLPRNAPVSQLINALRARNEHEGSALCDECNTYTQCGPDDLRFVDDTEEPPYTEVSPSF